MKFQPIDQYQILYGEWDDTVGYQFLLVKSPIMYQATVYFMSGADYGGGVYAIYKILDSYEFENIANQKGKYQGDIFAECEAYCKEKGLMIK
jgi:hypothetical protein